MLKVVGCSTISIFRQHAAFVRNVQIKRLISVSLYFYVPDEGSLLPKYRDCTTSNDFELYLMCCGVMLLLLIMTMYIFTYIYIYVNIYIVIIRLYNNNIL